MSTLIGVDDTPEPTSLKPSLIEPTSAHEETVIEPDTPEAAPTGQEPAPANYQFADDWTTHGTENFKPGSDTVDYPSGDRSRIQTMLSDIPAGMTTRDAQSATWLDALRGGMEALHPDTTQEGLSHREGAEWLQAIPSPVGPLRAGTPRLVTPDAGGVYSGDKARLMLRDSMKLGTTFTVPLWHSGFWVTLRAPSEGPLLELLRTITQDKISLGRATYGLLYSNMMVYTQRHLLDFIVEHVYETSLKVPGEIRKKISSLDLPLLALGAATVIWPRGFQYVRAILDQSDVQTGVVKGKISPSKTLWTDLETLTPWQIAHMASSGSGAMTDEMVERYRKEFTVGQGRVVELAPNVSVTLRVPSIAQYLASGQRWVRGIEQMATGALGLEDSDSARDSYILSQGKATNFRQFGHWVESMDASGSVISDEETLDATFNMLSSDDEIRKTFFEAVRKMMEDSTIAIAAVPVTEDTDTAPLPRFPHLLPLDVLSVFFTLLVQRVDQIDGR